MIAISLVANVASDGVAAPALFTDLGSVSGALLNTGGIYDISMRSFRNASTVLIAFKNSYGLTSFAYIPVQEADQEQSTSARAVIVGQDYQGLTTPPQIGGSDYKWGAHEDLYVASLVSYRGASYATFLLARCGVPNNTAADLCTFISTDTLVPNGFFKSPLVQTAVTISSVRKRNITDYYVFAISGKDVESNCGLYFGSYVPATQSLTTSKVGFSNGFVLQDYFNSPNTQALSINSDGKGVFLMSLLQGQEGVKLFWSGILDYSNPSKLPNDFVMKELSVNGTAFANITQLQVHQTSDGFFVLGRYMLGETPQLNVLFVFNNGTVGSAVLLDTAFDHESIFVYNNVVSVYWTSYSGNSQMVKRVRYTSNSWQWNVRCMNCASEVHYGSEGRHHLMVRTHTDASVLEFAFSSTSPKFYDMPDMFSVDSSTNPAQNLALGTFDPDGTVVVGAIVPNATHQLALKLYTAGVLSYSASTNSSGGGGGGGGDGGGGDDESDTGGKNKNSAGRQLPGALLLSLVVLALFH